MIQVPRVLLLPLNADEEPGKTIWFCMIQLQDDAAEHQDRLGWVAGGHPEVAFKDGHPWGQLLHEEQLRLLKERIRISLHQYNTLHALFKG